MTKKPIVIFLAVLVIGAGIISYFFSQKKLPANQLLGKEVILYQYTINGQPTGKASLSIPFAANTDQDWFLNLLIDVNDNNQFESANEWLIKNQVARIKENYRNNFVLDLIKTPIKSNQTIKVKAILSSTPLSADWSGALPQKNQNQEITATIKAYELADLLGVNVAGANENLKRGISQISLVQTAQAAESPQNNNNVNVFRQAPVPDLRQNPMECTPTAAANNLISLAQQHNADNRLPADSQQLIDELKNDMQFNNGVLLRNITAGKNAFTQRHNLPIITEQINQPTFQDIVSALQRDCVVELSMAWVRSASGQSNTGHVVSAVGVSAANGVPQVQVHDPATPEGLDTYDLSFQVQAGDKRFEGIDYPLWDGTAFIDAIFIQCWTGAEQATTGLQPNTSRVEMLVINGHYFPKNQFRVGHPDVCDSPHYHAGGQVYGLQNRDSTEIVSMVDPTPTGCGFGKVSEVPVEFIDITLEQSTELIKYVVP